MDTKTEFREWAMVELFGHQQIVGIVSEATIGGCSFLRVDVPASDTEPAFTKYFGNGAIYAMTPVNEEVGKRLLEKRRHRPHFVYELQGALSLPAPNGEKSYFAEEDDLFEEDDA